MSSEDTKLTKSEKWLLIVVTLFVVIVAGSVFWWEQNNILPEIAIPTPVMPNPNALDYYVLAGGQLSKVSLTPASASPWAVCWNFSSAQQALNDQRWGNLKTGDLVPSSAELHALLRAGAPGFATLRQGFQYECRMPPARSFDTLFPQFGIVRAMARVLRFKADVQARDGNWGGAFDTALDGKQLGVTLPRGGVLIAMLVGVACEAITRDGAWDAVGHLTAAQARAGARRMATINAKRTPFADTLREEKWCTLASLLELFHTPNWQQLLLRCAGNGPPQTTPEWLWRARLSMVNRREFFAHYTRYMDALIANAQLPYAAPKTQPAIPTDPISQMIFPVFAKAGFKDVANRTQDALLETTLALRAYQLDHTQYPASLAALVPGYLAAVPDDPFALSGPLKYKLKGHGYVLYSIGPDGKDNGGTPSADGNKATVPTGKTSDFLSETSTGDIVARVNIR